MMPKRSRTFHSEPSVDEAPTLEICWMWSTFSLPLLSGPLSPRVEAPDKVLSMGQREQSMCANKWLMLNCDCYIAIIETI